MNENNPRCNDCIVLWPDVEAIDIYCTLPPDHDGPHRERGGVWGDHVWDDSLESFRLADDGFDE